MAKKVKGTVKRCGIAGTTRNGYRAVWDMGKASGAKKMGKVSGPDRPST
ncbi:MAG: hypothetical protein HPY89_06375 [Pelotomaculum sp.]|uniref:Uncharacterized protein n=1 Tax=Pelotomaculum thermopropionicum (strain DSM 13744 / JCM 10971 / SI) TaxID=370438 RepID=A5D3K1_PELTS|nr:hypothetical protein [Pelotomaculum sp.]BAF59174.1 hypothetical protein PTH_0993 [Pelotomaculum thermopropionicum SI]